VNENPTPGQADPPPPPPPDETPPASPPEADTSAAGAADSAAPPPESTTELPQRRRAATTVAVDAQALAAADGAPQVPTAARVESRDLPTGAVGDDDDDEPGPDGLPELDTREVMSRLRAGEEIQRATLKTIRTPRQIEHPVRIHRCTIRGLRLDQTTFTEPVEFSRCTIHGIGMTKAQFRQGVVFRNCTFVGATTMRRMKVSGRMALRDCTFESRFSLIQSEIDDLDGWDAQYNGWVDFAGLTIGKLDMRSADFAAGFVMNGVTVKGDALFRGMTISKKFALERGTRIDGALDLSKARMDGFSYLTELEFGPDATLCVWNATPQALLISESQVSGRLASERAGDHGKAAEEYGVLKNNYQRLNRLDEEDWAYYHFKRQRRLAGRGSGGTAGKIGRGLDWLVFDIGCAYGTSPLRVMRSAAVVILAFAVVYLAVMIGTAQTSLDAAGAAAQPFLSTYNFVGVTAIDKVLSALIHSTSAFVFGFDSIDKNVEGWPALLLTLEGLIGMLLFGLFIVSFSRKVIR
jgi:uncharacterized protein YjbI with pentapeptide repeats